MELVTDQKALEGLWHKVVAQRDFKQGEEIGREYPFLGPVIKKQDHFNFEKNWSWDLTDLYFGQKAKFETKFYGSKWSYAKWDDEDSRELKQLRRKYSVSESEVKWAHDIITTNYLKLDLYRDYEKQIQLYSGGMFEIFSMLNHSCDPNAKLIDEMGEENHAFKKKVLLAKKNIQKGEEITITYMSTVQTTDAAIPKGKAIAKAIVLLRIPDLSNQPKTERQRLLKEHYGFDCVCNYCNKDLSC